MPGIDPDRERIHALWDALADADASDPDAALNLLLSYLCQLVDAQNANWVGAVRLPDIVPGDPLHGWRPRLVHHLHPIPTLVRTTNEQRRLLDAGVIDVTTVRNVALAGTFRCNRLVDLVGEDWFDSEYCRHFYMGVGRVDAIWCGFPVSPDAEAYIGIFRLVPQPRFTAADRDAVAAALRGLKWFLRQTLLARNLLAASDPLTPAELGVLKGLLGGRVEKLIADSLGLSPHTTHDYVKSIYRKFGVKNRAALMALWLGKVG